MTREEWEKADENTKGDEYAERRGSERETEGSDREDFFRQQLENVKEWLSNVHKKTLERQQKDLLANGKSQTVVVQCSQKDT